MFSSLFLLFWASVPFFEDDYDIKGWVVFGVALVFNWFICNGELFYNPDCTVAAPFLP